MHKVVVLPPFKRGKMKIKLLTCLSGNNTFQEIGDILEVDEETANLMIERGIASEVKTTKKKTDETNKNTTKKR